MGRRRANKRHIKYAQNEAQHAPDPLTRAISAHPTREQVAIAVGPCVRIVQCGSAPAQAAKTLDAGGGEAAAAVRVVQFSPDGKLLLTAGDERLVRVWDTTSWECIASWKASKKLCAGAFTQDSKYPIVADKYGDVLIGDCSVQNLPAQPQVPQLLLGHLCSVVSSLVVSPDSKYVVSCDKDRKVRVSVLPDKALLGSVEIQSYCLGHTYFVSSATWLAASSSTGQQLLVTGSGDGTVRLWDPVSGKLLDTLVVSEPVPDTEQEAAMGTAGAGRQDDSPGAEPAGTSSSGKAGAGAGAGEQAALGGQAMQEQSAEGAHGGEGQQGGAEDEGDACEVDGEGNGDDGDGDGGEEGDGGERPEDDRVAMGPKCAPVTCVASSSDGLVVATLVEGRDEMLVLRVDPATCKLSLAQQLSVPGVRYPSHAAFDCQDRLWVVGGPPLDSSRSAHVGVAQRSGTGEYAATTAEVLPAAVLAALELRSEEEEKQVESGALVPAFTKQLMIYRKRWLTPEHLEAAKRQRRDFRESERLRQLVDEQKQQQ